MRYARRLLGDDVEKARDVVQESFLKLCRECRRPDRRRALIDHVDEWLYRVCRNHAIDIFRKEKRMNVMSNALLRDTMDPSSADRATPNSPQSTGPRVLLEQRERREQLAASIRALSPRQQELVYLKFEGGLSYKQIASITKLSQSNVGYILHTAMRALRDSLSRPAPLSHDSSAQGGRAQVSSEQRASAPVSSSSNSSSERSA